MSAVKREVLLERTARDPRRCRTVNLLREALCLILRLVLLRGMRLHAVLTAAKKRSSSSQGLPFL